MSNDTKGGPPREPLHGTAPTLKAVFSPRTWELLQLDPGECGIQYFKDKFHQRIAELQQETQALKSFYNSAVSVAFTRLLPPEILNRIFVIHRNDSDRTGLSWIKVTHICRRWRQIALADPLLWSDIGVLHEEFTPIMLERSKAAPLTIRAIVDLDPVITNKLLGNALEAAHRIRSLHLVARDSEIKLDKALKSLCTKPAPILETLVLQAGGWGGDLPTSFLSHGAPSLRRVKIVGYSIPWGTMRGWAGGLTVLQLHNETHRPEYRPTSFEFHRLINQFSHLNILELLQLVPRDLHAEGAPGEPPIHGLPQIRSLKLYDSDTTLRGFFQCFRVPPSAKVDVTITNNQASPTQTFSELVSSIRLSLWSHGAGSYDERFFDKGIPPSTRLEELRIISFGFGARSRPRFELLFSSDGNQPDWTISFTKAPGSEALAAMLRVLDAYLDFSTLRVLKVVQTPESFTPKQWKSIFKDLPALETVVFLYVPMFGFLQELLEDVGVGSGVKPNPGSVAPRAGGDVEGQQTAPRSTARRWSRFLSLSGRETRTTAETSEDAASPSTEEDIPTEVDQGPGFRALTTLVYTESYIPGDLRHRAGLSDRDRLTGQTLMKVLAQRPGLTAVPSKIPVDVISPHPYYASES